MHTKRRRRNNAAGDLVPVASKPASVTPHVKASAADPFIDGLSKGMRELDGGLDIGSRTVASPATAAKNTDTFVGALDNTAAASRQPVIKPVEFPKYTHNAAGEIVPVETNAKQATPTLASKEDGFTAGLDEGMKDLPEVKETGPEGIDFAAEGGKTRGGFFVIFAPSAIAVVVAASRQPVIKHVNLVKGKYTSNAAGEVIPLGEAAPTGVPKRVNDSGVMISKPLDDLKTPHVSKPASATPTAKAYGRSICGRPEQGHARDV